MTTSEKGNEPRKQFTFWRDWFNALKLLNSKDRAALIMGICEYCLDGTEPQLSGTPAIVFASIRNSMDNSWKRSVAGRKGGRAKTEEKANGSKSKAKSSKSEANVSKVQAGTGTGYESGTGTGYGTVCYPPTPLPEPAEANKPDPVETELSRLSPALRTVMEKWLQYKQERREAYKPTGLTALVSQVINEAGKFGEQPVVDVVELSMANGYKGIVFDRLKQQGNSGVRQKSAQQSRGNVFLKMLEDEP